MNDEIEVPGQELPAPDRKAEARDILKALVPPYINDYRSATVRFMQKKKLPAALIEEFLEEVPTGVEGIFDGEPAPVVVG